MRTNPRIKGVALNCWANGRVAMNDVWGFEALRISVSKKSK